MARIVEQRARGDRGAVIVFVAVALAMIFAFAALAVDTAQHVNDRQVTRDTLDAAAHAGAYHLPASGAGVADAVVRDVLASVQANDPSVSLDAEHIQFFCVTASEGDGSGGYRPAPYTESVCETALTTGRVCTAEMCATPCFPRSGDRCNTVRVVGDKDVDYRFAPVIGQDRGNIGSLASAACKGPCTEARPAPLDLVLVLDRTASMCTGWNWNTRECDSGNEVTELRDALNGVGSEGGVFGELDQAVHRVSLATINTAIGVDDCGANATLNHGEWVPVRPPTVDFAANDGAVRSCVDALPESLTSVRASQTNFSDPIDQAIAVLNAAKETHPSGLEPQRAIIFMTDGEPNLPHTRPCAAGIDAAQRAKDAGIAVATIAYRLDSSHTCGSSDYDGVRATELLSDMATQQGDGAGVDHCAAGPSGAVQENTDGDMFFCAPNASHLRSVFAAAIAAVSTDIRLIRLPTA